MKKIIAFFFLLFILFNDTVLALDAKTYIPPQAFRFKNIIKNELDLYFSELYNYNYLPSLIEHESCISLTHSKCWNSMSRLKTKREEGAGLVMITRAYREDGSLRFDKLTEMRNLYKEELKDAKWETIYQRPDIQIRIAILILREDYKKLYSVKDPEIRMHMTDAAYNGGINGVLKERRICGMAKDCNPNIWFGHVEKYSSKSNKILYGNRSATDINRHHVRDVFYNRLPKYNLQYFTKKDFLVKDKQEQVKNKETKQC